MEALEPVFRFFKNFPAILWLTFVGFAQWFIPRTWYVKDVSNDIVLITGASSGLGRQIALEYAKLGSSLVLWDINAPGLEETKSLIEAEHERFAASKLKGSSKESLNQGEEEARTRFCRTYLADVSDRAEVYARARQVYLDLNEGVDLRHEKEKYVSVLINNAGIYHGLYLQDLKDEQIERIFKINIIAHFWTVRAFLPKMIEHERGHIVEIASMGGISGLHKQADYCATKFATGEQIPNTRVGFEESLSIELDSLGLSDKIYTTAICPFFFQSNLFTGFNANAVPIMSCKYVAREAVLSMRCNHARVLLPARGYFINLLRPLTPRRALFMWSRALGFEECITTIKGAAAATAK